MTRSGIPDGIVAVVKEDCPTCHLVAPVLRELVERGVPLTVYTQDDPTFPPGIDATGDTQLETSYRLKIEAVPALLRIEGGCVVARTAGWSRADWEALTGVTGLGPGLPELRPGCGSRSVEPGVAEELAVRYGRERLQARSVELAELEDEIEACFDRGWTDGLPVVPPTPLRVIQMLEGTSREPDEVVAIVPPDRAPCTVEKVAINAVMAGCRPAYLPVVLAALEAACMPEFNLHGVLATTYSVGPVVIVNGPVRRAIGMNWGINVLGQGNRANATIGRALQLIVRNVGGGRPGEIDRATLGNPGKYTFCFAENEEDSPWEPLAVERGLPAGVSAVTLFAGEGPRTVFDQLSRQPESLARSFARCLESVAHPKLVRDYEAVVVVSPEHGRVFRESGWTKRRLREEILEQLVLPGEAIVRGAGGIAEGMPAAETLPKFLPDRLWFVHAGGPAGLFSSIIGSWVAGPAGSQPVTREVTS
ncbi:MAG TPA: thioredoxin family protein [Chloroflexota bacterium]|nr:thioredoxin family protein [Chloroflexota bacterium]